MIHNSKKKLKYVFFKKLLFFCYYNGMDDKTNKSEIDRIKTLIDYDILYSQKDKKFDDLIKLSSNIFKSRFVGISFIDQNNQWLKSTIGIEDINEIPKNVSLCQDTINSNEPILINDINNEIKFKENPWLKKYPDICFYLGFPLIAPNNQKIGTLFFLDNTKRNISENELESLKIISNQIISELEIRTSFKKIIKQSKLTTLNEFGNSIAHEINNPLTIINANLSLLKRTIPVEKMNNIEACQRSVDRIVMIVKGIRKFSGTDYSTKEVHFNLKDITNEVLSLVGSKLSKFGIDLIVDLDDLNLIGNDQDFSHVIMSLIKNSMDALSKKDESLKKWIKITIKNNEFEIVDSGNGVCFSVQDKLFLPFVSTKKEVTGVGLELSIAKGIIEQHGGKICYSLKDGNTSFKLSF